MGNWKKESSISSMSLPVQNNAVGNYKLNKDGSYSYNATNPFSEEQCLEISPQRDTIMTLFNKSNGQLEKYQSPTGNVPGIQRVNKPEWNKYIKSFDNFINRIPGARKKINNFLYADAIANPDSWTTVTAEKPMEVLPTNKQGGTLRRV